MREIPFLAKSCLCVPSTLSLSFMALIPKRKPAQRGKKEREIRTSQAVSITSSPTHIRVHIVERHIRLCKYFWATRVQIQWRRDMASPTTRQKYRLFQSEARSNFFQIIMLKTDPLRHLISKRELKDGSTQPLFKHSIAAC